MSVRRTIRHPGTSASRRAIESEGIIFLRRDVASRYYSTRRRRRSASPPHHVSPSDGTPRLSPEPRSVRRASIRRAPSRRVFRRLEVHGVLGEEVLAFGRLGDHAEEGLEGEAGDGEEGGEQNHHRDAEGAGALGTRGRGKGGRVGFELRFFARMKNTPSFAGCEPPGLRGVGGILGLIGGGSARGSRG